MASVKQSDKYQYMRKSQDKWEKTGGMGQKDDLKSFKMLKSSITRRNLVLIAVLMLISLQLTPMIFQKSTVWPVREQFESKGLNMGPPMKNPTLRPKKKHLKIGNNGAVASDVKQCSELGGKFLQKNGTAADAAVAVALCIGTINMFSSGIGGGGFILSSKGDEVISIDAREQAPNKATVDMFNGSCKGTPTYQNSFEELITKYPSKFGGLSVAVPGELKGLYTLYEKHGSGNISWKELVESAANIADNGWKASPLLGEVVKLGAPALKQKYHMWKMFVKNYHEVLACEKKQDNCEHKLKLIESGDIIRRPEFAATLRMIANNGSDAIFYDPKEYIAQSMALTVQKYNGILEASDFREYQVRESRARSTLFLDDVEVSVPNSGCSSGIAILGGLHIINHEFESWNKNPDFAKGNDLKENSTQRLVETLKWMGAARSKLGDDVGSESERKSQKERIYSILEDEWALSAFNNISYRTKDWKEYAPDFQPVVDNGTAHFSVVDKYGNAVSMTTSVNLIFGSLLVDPSTGIVLNDQMDDFSLPDQDSNAFDLVPSIYNYISPGKRPLSSMVPVITKKNGKIDFVVGAAGGSRIYTSVFQALVRRYVYKLPILHTIAYPRLHHQLLPEVLYMENFTTPGLIEGLTSRGHKIEVTEAKSVMNAISEERGSWNAVSDWWRKQGVAWAY